MATATFVTEDSESRENVQRQPVYVQPLSRVDGLAFLRLIYILELR